MKNSNPAMEGLCVKILLDMEFVIVLNGILKVLTS
jgi:hypothetical protein